MAAKILPESISSFGMLKFTLLHQFHTLSRISSETKVNLQCVATILASLLGFVLSCLILGYITKRRNNDGSYSSKSYGPNSYSSNSYGPYGGYYGGDDTISYYDDDDMIDGVLIPGLLAVQGLLLIGE